MRIITLNMKTGRSSFMTFRFGASVQAQSLLDQLEWTELPYLSRDGTPVADWQVGGLSERYGSPPGTCEVDAGTARQIMEYTTPASESEEGRASGSDYDVVRRVILATLAEAERHNCTVEMINEPYYG